jgi:hypothetical protein
MSTDCGSTFTTTDGSTGSSSTVLESMLLHTVGALVAATTPLVDACHRLAPIGRVGLWNEVGDLLGLAVDEGGRADEAARRLLAAAVAVPGTPWRATPALRVVDDEVLGPTVVRRKGGCCLAYKCDHDDSDATDPDHVAYVARFGDEAPHYCNTCKFRDHDDSAARQLFWRRLEHRRQEDAS